MGNVFDEQKVTRAVFLDRDGVINRKLPEDRYVCNHEEFELIPGVRAALSIFSRLGYLLVVVTNQRGIARGLMDENALDNVHDYMKLMLSEKDVSLDGLYYCPHDRDEGCQCRKPRPGMILQAARDLNIDLGSSFMIGDSDSDVEAAINAGVRAVRIAPEQDPRAFLTFPALLDFAQYLENSEFALEQSPPGNTNRYQI